MWTSRDFITFHFLYNFKLYCRRYNPLLVLLLLLLLFILSILVLVH